MNKMVKLIILQLLFSSILIFADGGGGIMFGTQIARFPLFDENVTMRNNSMNLFYTGGFGYGILDSGQMIGGFGIYIGDSENEDGTGGIGGMLFGHRIIGKPLFLALLLNIGAGGIAAINKVNGYSGNFVLFGELSFEAGLPVFPWFMLSGYAGYQVMADVLTWRLFDLFISYTPVVGVKFSFGKFY